MEAHPDITEAAVCAYPDAELGERVCACVVSASGGWAPSLETLCDYLLGRGLAKFKLPERIHYVPALPRNPMGKVVRTALQALLTTQEENC
jgi:non-ribosomal peptide synthetase component E (peptide arylation enzyme)